MAKAYPIASETTASGRLGLLRLDLVIASPKKLMLSVH